MHHGLAVIHGTVGGTCTCDAKMIWQCHQATKRQDAITRRATKHLILSKADARFASAACACLNLLAFLFWVGRGDTYSVARTTHICTPLQTLYLLANRVLGLRYRSQC